MTKETVNKVAWLYEHTNAYMHGRITVRKYKNNVRVYCTDHDGVLKDNFDCPEVVNMCIDMHPLRLMLTSDLEGRVYILLF